MKDFFLGIVSILVALIFLAVGGEIAVRAFNLNQKSFSKITVDDALGWLPAANYLYSGELLDAGGERYSADIQSDADGFRIFGNPHEKSKKKVLFLGDSFTQAMHVSNDKTYYGLLEKTLDIEVFALGVEGYGTLQESMMLDKYIDQIQPDIVVIQFCANDFINNFYDLELISTSNNNGLRRPYFEDNEVVYKTPSRFAAIREFAVDYSHFLYFIISKIDVLNATPTDSSAELIRAKGMSYPLFKESVEITEELLKNMRKRIPSTTPVYSFSDASGFPYGDEFKRISENSGVQYIDGIAKAMSLANRNGITTTAADKSHWNKAGHQIVADVLQGHFDAAKNSELPSTAPP